MVKFTSEHEAVSFGNILDKGIELALLCAAIVNGYRFEDKLRCQLVAPYFRIMASTIMRRMRKRSRRFMLLLPAFQPTFFRPSLLKPGLTAIVTLEVAKSISEVNFRSQFWKSIVEVKNAPAAGRRPERSRNGFGNQYAQTFTVRRR
jgi:hypothetical protein